MNSHKLTKPLFMSPILMAAPLIAVETEIQGQVQEVSGGRVKIAYQGNFIPNIGYPVDIGFKLDKNFIPGEGKWKIVEVNFECAWASARGKTGDPAVDYLVTIQSDSLKRRARRKQIFMD